MSLTHLHNPKEQDGEAVVKRGGSRQYVEDHGSSAWKVAFADFCLALMALFLVLWVMAARDKERTEQIVKKLSSGTLHADGQGHIADMMGGPRGSLIDREPMTPGEGGRWRNDAKPRLETAAELRELSQVLVKLTEQAGLADNLQTIVTPYGLRVMLHDTFKQGVFERGSATPQERFRQLLRTMGPVFDSIQNQMLIIGHTDSLPYADRGHDAFSNWSLSSNRALAARANLLAGGMNESTILQVVGMADQAPLDSTDPRAGVNRRVELMILTSAQARLIAGMFGAPDEVSPLINGVDTAVPDSKELMELRKQLEPEKAARPSSLKHLR